MIEYLETLEEMIPGNSIVFRGFQCLIGSCYFPALKLKAASTIQVLKNTSYTVCCFLTTHGCGKNSRGFLCVYQIQHYGCLQSAHILANAICLKLRSLALKITYFNSLIHLIPLTCVSTMAKWFLTILIRHII